MRKIKKTIGFTSVFISLLTIALIAYGLANVGTLSVEVESQIYDYGVPGLFIISMLLDMIPQFISPVVAMATAIILGINVYTAIIITILGSSIGSFIGFTLGRKYMFEAVDAMTSKKSVKKLTHLTNKYGKIIVPLAAISPVPYVPVLLGAINFSRKNFIIYGLIPRTLSFIALALIISIF